MDDARFTMPLYTVKSAASHLGMPVSTLRGWVNKKDLITALETDFRSEARLPFIALVEAQLYLAFRQGGMSMQAINSGMKAVRDELGTDMLKSNMLAADGKDILINLAKTSSDAEWVRARDMQWAIPKIVDEGLRLITWGDQDYPQTIKLTAYGDSHIVADYRYAFGQPIVFGTRTKVDDVIQLFKAGESIAVICDEYDIDRGTVESIIRPHVSIAA